jgi:general nucleoside transport system permease protein
MAELLRFLANVGLALAVFAAVLLLCGKHPLQAYEATAVSVFSTARGFSELLVRAGPLMLAAIAVSLPARIGLINVGGEGQIYMGALFATGAALGLSQLPGWLLLPTTIAAGFLGGAVWALPPALLRMHDMVNETISTLLLNYVAPLIVGWFIFGPWRSSDSSSYPQSPELVAGARLPMWPGTRLHAGLLIALGCLVIYHLIAKYTRWGLDMRAIGGNAVAAETLGLPVRGYILWIMVAAGGCAGLAGMAEVCAIQGRLVSEVSPGYGFMGFLVAWLAGQSVLGIATMSLLFALISSVGDVLQITQGVPFSVINILTAALLLIVLCGKKKGPQTR